ncbi:kinesin-II 85 kDa subunit-like [Protopterus annectens]|uniref:kinesin-II 85 kDa subunit-like n=1 Tax=Protopterus annectens TaxID=7888 RepID=UPI001CFBA1A1|nr:kinesin-II 85 kDa subunit-like [Protopterus annectens]
MDTSTKTEEVSVTVAVGLKQTTDEESRNVFTVVNEHSKVFILANKEHAFTFHGVFSLDNDQENIYAEIVRPLLDRIISGYNVSLLVSGTSSSEKESLLFGNDKQHGIIKQLTADFFGTLKETRHPDDFLVSVAFIQFYAEGMATDLLNQSEHELRIFQHSTLGIVVEGCTEVVAFDPKDVHSLYIQGRRNQKTTGQLQLSSLFTLTVEQKEGLRFRRSTVQIFDLTTEEFKTHVKGISLSKEASQMASKETTNALSLLLQEAMEGNGFTVLLLCLDLQGMEPDEILNMLSLAAQVMDNTKRVSPFFWYPTQVIQNLRKEIQEVRQTILSSSSLPEDEVKNMANTIQELKIVKNQIWEKKKEMYAWNRKGKNPYNGFSTTSSQADIEKEYHAALSRRKQLEADHHYRIQEQILLMQLELEKVSSDTSSLESREMMKMKKDYHILLLQKEALQRERDEAEGDLESLYMQYRQELEKQKAHSLQVTNSVT